jgi:uncharacterized protein (DUF58 family)
MTRPSLLKRRFYRNFSAYFSIKQRWQRRFTPAGRFVQIALLVSAVIGLNTRQAVAYQIFGLLLALQAVALIFTGVISLRRYRVALTVRRTLPRYATVGVRFDYPLRIAQQGGQPRDGLSLFEIGHDPRPDLAQFCHAQEPGAARRNRFDRAVGYYRWAWLVRMNAVAVIDEISVPPLAADAAMTLTGHCTPHARGVLALDGIALARRDPFGLCRAYRIIDLPGNVLVLPRTYRLPPLGLPGQLHAQSEHQLSAAQSADGEEISGLRNYRPGDPMRDIHWKSFARTGQPMVKEYQAEYFERHALLLDTSGAVAGAAFEDAVALAASLVGDVQQVDVLLDLLFIGGDCHCFTMGPGQLQAEALLRVLAEVRPCPDDALRALHANVASRSAALSSCICILLAWNRERQSMIDALRQRGLPLLIWLVVEQRPADCPAWVRVLHPGRIEEGLGQP